MEICMKKYDYPLLNNVHLYAEPPTKNGKTYLTQGNFTYYHYKCDNFDDIGWGCGYRTLQSVCSWIINTLELNRITGMTEVKIKSTKITTTTTEPATTSSSSTTTTLSRSSSSSSPPSSSSPSGGFFEIENSNGLIPSIAEIQSILVNISDKPKSFLGSREWIGALEVFYVIDTLYDASCRILHVPQSEDIKKYANIVKKYFEDYGGLIMMGGDIDASSKGIAGIHISSNQAYFLVIDPHFVGKVKSPHELIEKNYIRWQHTSQFVDSSFYNLCLPQIKAKNF